MNRTYLDRGWTIERREAVGYRYQRMLAAKTRKAYAAIFVKCR